MKVHGKVGSRLRGAAEHVHAIVQHSGQVGVHVGEGVEEEQGPRRGAGEVACVERRNRPTRPEAYKVVRPA